MWYHRVIGGERCPIVDTWWQTETGAIMITPLPAVTETRPGSVTEPFPGVSVSLLDDDGNSVDAGYLAITETLAVDAAHDLRGRPEVSGGRTGPSGTGSTFRVTARSGRRTASCGSWAASMTCSTWLDTASARWKSRAPSSITPRWRRPRW